MSPAIGFSNAPYWADVFDTNGNRLTDGPVTGIQRVMITRSLDEIGDWSMSVLLDRRSGLFRSERQVNIYTDFNNSKHLLVSGVIRSAEESVSGNQSIINVSGPDLTNFLKRRMTLIGRNFNHVTLTNACNGLIALVPGWSVNVDSAVANLRVDMRYDNSSVYQAFRDMTKRYGIHARQNSANPKRLDIGKFGSDSGLNIQAVETVTYENLKNEKLLLSRGFNSENSSWEVVNRLFPFGAGEGRAAITLEHVARSTPYAVRELTAPDGTMMYYIEDSDSVSKYGLIERVENFNQIRALDNTEDSLELASEALYDAATIFLQRYSEPFESYNATVYNAIGLQPGDTVDVRYRAFIEDSAGSFPYINVNGKYWILRVTERHQGGNVDTQLMLGNHDRQPDSAAQKMLDLYIESRQRDNSPSIATNLRSYSHSGSLSPTSNFRIPLTFTTAILNVYRIAVSIETRGTSNFPTNISILFDDVNVTQRLAGQSIVDTQQDAVEIIMDSAELLEILRDSGLKKQHYLEVSCLRGTGEIDALVEVYESTQAISIEDLEGGSNLKPSLGLLGILNLRGAPYTSGVALDWTLTLSAVGYRVRYRRQDQSNWRTGVVVTESNAYQKVISGFSQGAPPTGIISQFIAPRRDHSVAIISDISTIVTGSAATTGITAWIGGVSRSNPTIFQVNFAATSTALFFRVPGYSGPHTTNFGATFPSGKSIYIVDSDGVNEGRLPDPVPRTGSTRRSDAGVTIRDFARPDTWANTGNFAFIIADSGQSEIMQNYFNNNLAHIDVETSGVVGETYDFQVQGYDNTGKNGAWSDTISTTLAYTNATPVAVTGIKRVYADDYNMLFDNDDLFVNMDFEFDPLEAEDVLVQIYGRASSGAAWASNGASVNVGGNSGRVTVPLRRANTSSEFPYQWRLDFTARNRNGASSWLSASTTMFLFEFSPPAAGVVNTYGTAILDGNWVENFVGGDYPLGSVIGNYAGGGSGLTNRLGRFRFSDDGNQLWIDVVLGSGNASDPGYISDLDNPLDGVAFCVGASSFTVQNPVSAERRTSRDNGNPLRVRYRYNVSRPSTWIDGVQVSCINVREFNYNSASQAEKNARALAFLECNNLGAATVRQGITGVNVTPGNGQGRVTWNTATGISSYELQYRKVGEAGTVVKSITTPYTITGLVNGDEYEVIVRVPGGLWSNVVSFTPGRVPDAPAGVKVSSRAGGLFVEWEAAYGHGLPVIDYSVYWTGGSRRNIQGRSFLITGLTNGNNYSVQVTARNVRGNSRRSAAISKRPEALPSVPSGLSVSTGVGSLDVSWNAAARADSYEIQWTDNTSIPSSYSQDEVRNRFYHIDGLQPGTSISVRVRAVGDSGEGGWSSWVSRTPVAFPPIPHNLVVTARDSGFSAAWKAVPEATWYKLRYRTVTGQWTETSQLTGTSRIVTVTAGAKLFVQVQSGNTVAESLWSHSEAVTPTGFFS